MAWYGLVGTDGDLVSIGTESMFEGGVVPTGGTYADYEVIEFGEERPDLALKVWERLQRRFVDRPIPIKADRIEDIRVRLEADPDFFGEFSRISVARRQNLLRGMARVLAQVLGGQRWREEDEEAEL